MIVASNLNGTYGIKPWVDGRVHISAGKVWVLSPIGIRALPQISYSSEPS